MAAHLLNAILKLSTNNEGGYVNHSSDPGGPTNHGITIKTLAASRGHAVTIADVKALTLAEANAIYVKNYWKPIWGDQLPPGLDYAMFDFGINSGCSRAVKTLQGMLPGCAVDGLMGAKTLAAIAAFDTDDLIKKLCAARLKFMQSLGTFSKFGRGWTYRVTGVDPKRQFKRVPGVVGDSLAMANNAQGSRPVIPVTLLPFPLDDILPLGKARDVDIKVLAPLTNKLQAGVLTGVAGASGISALPSIVGGMLPQLQQAKDTLETVKDVSQVLQWCFVAITIVLVFATLAHTIKKLREPGLNT